MGFEERIAQLEFQVELLFNNSSVDRLFFESKITREQYTAIMDLLDSFRAKLDNGQSVHHYEFEKDFCKQFQKYWRCPTGIFQENQLYFGK